MQRRNHVDNGKDDSGNYFFEVWRTFRLFCKFLNIILQKIKDVTGTDLLMTSKDLLANNEFLEEKFFLGEEIWLF